MANEDNNAQDNFTPLEAHQLSKKRYFFHKKNIFYFIIIFALLGSFFCNLILWQNYQQLQLQQNDTLKQMSYHQTRLSQQSTSLQEQTQNILEYTNTFSNKINKQESIMLAEIDIIHTDLSRLKSDLLLINTNHFFVLNEIRFFIQLAYRKMYFEEEYVVAKNLLIEAHRLLQQIKNLNIIPLKKAIQSDISSLEKYLLIDKDAIMIDLDRFRKEIDDLIFNQKYGHNQIEPQKKSEKNIPTSWQEKIILFLKDWLIIKSNKAETTQKLLVDEAWYIKENMRLKLIQAQTALMSKDYHTFYATLSYVDNMTREYFAINDEKTALMLSLFETWQNIPFHSTIQEFKSLNMLDKLDIEKIIEGDSL